MTNIIMALSAGITAIATGVIAWYTIENHKLTKRTLDLTQATHELNKTIKASADQHQQNIEKLQIDLAAAQLYAATDLSGKPMKPGKLDEFRKIVTKDL